MADYTTIAAVKAAAGGVWTPDTAIGFGETRDQIIAGLITTTSRMFDRETGRPANWWASLPGQTRPYSGSGSQWLDIDEWDAITAVTMSSMQNRSDAITLSLTPGTADYVAFEPVYGPPYNRLFLLRGWLPDIFYVGNVHVTGTPTLPAEIGEAVAIWAAFRYKLRDAAWNEVAPGQLGGAAIHAESAARTNVYIPPDTLRVIDYFKEYTGPQIAMVSGGSEPRTSQWISWQSRDLGPGHGP